MAVSIVGTGPGTSAARPQRTTVGPKPAAVTAAGPAAKPAAKPAKPAAATAARPAVIVSTAQPAVTTGTYTAASVKQASAAVEAKPAPGGGTFVAGTGHVVVDVMASDSGYDNKLYWSSDNWKTKNYIGIDNQTQTVDLGSFAPGTSIEFGIDNGQGQFFKTGAASSNPDHIEHATVDRSTDSTAIGFEDLYGGGDRDFNDAILRVRSLTGAVSAPPAIPTPSTGPAAPAVPPAAGNDNRSGLGDGTNPGNGTGHTSSPNQGTDNPSQSSKSAASTVPAGAARPVTGDAATRPAASPVLAAAAKPVAHDASTKAATSAVLAAVAKPASSAAAAAKPVTSAAAKPVTSAVLAGAVQPATSATRPAAAATPARAVKPATAAAVTSAPVVGSSANRSGLADGTNPGNAVKSSSPNQGTSNPNQASKPAAVAVDSKKK